MSSSVLDKMELVKKILVELHKRLKDGEDNGRRHLSFKRLDPFDFVTAKANPRSSPKSVNLTSCHCAVADIADVKKLR